jgi:5-methylcytosine-specific restriction endonuclease McrA
MDEALRRLVWERARHRCEYCKLPQAYSTLAFEVDHVIARKHGGPTAPGNLALTCFYCNSLNYVSCGPFRVPIARLAAAQAALGE